MNLYELTEQQQQLISALESITEQDAPDAEAAQIVESALAQIEGEIEAKFEACAKVVRQYEALADAREQEAQHLRARAGMARRNAARLKDWMMLAMESSGKRKVEAGAHTISLVANGGKLPLIIDETVTPETVDATYVVTQLSFDKTAIAADLEAGENIPWAKFGERGQHVRVK